MSNVWATMPCVQLSHNILVNCIDNRQNQLFSEMSLRNVMELPTTSIVTSVHYLVNSCKNVIIASSTHPRVQGHDYTLFL